MVSISVIISNNFITGGYKMGNLIKGFVLMIGQILKKLIIVVILAGLVYAGYIAWGKFIKKTQKHSKSAAVSRAAKQGIDVNK